MSNKITNRFDHFGKVEDGDFYKLTTTNDRVTTFRKIYINETLRPFFDYKFRALKYVVSIAGVRSSTMVLGILAS